MGSTPADELKGFDTSKLPSEDDDAGEPLFLFHFLTRRFPCVARADVPDEYDADARLLAYTLCHLNTGPTVVPETGAGSDSKVKVILGLLKKSVSPHMRSLTDTSKLQSADRFVRDRFCMNSG